jgi:hypothetical protein
MGSGCPLLGAEDLSNLLKSIYLIDDFPILNEAPASIGQLLRTRKHGRLVDALKVVASEHDMMDELCAFLNHYPPQTQATTTPLE